MNYAIKKTHIASFDKIILRIKTLILRHRGEVVGKVYDKEVAEALRIDPAKFRNLKSRGDTPYAEICDYCYLNDYSINEVLKD